MTGLCCPTASIPRVPNPPIHPSPSRNFQEPIHPGRVLALLHLYTPFRVSPKLSIITRSLCTYLPCLPAFALDPSTYAMHIAINTLHAACHACALLVRFGQTQATRGPLRTVEYLRKNQGYPTPGIRGKCQSQCQCLWPSGRASIIPLLRSQTHRDGVVAVVVAVA
jgi:hypothetical protein